MKGYANCKYCQGTGERGDEATIGLGTCYYVPMEGCPVPACEKGLIWNRHKHLWENCRHSFHLKKVEEPVQLNLFKDDIFKSHSGIDLSWKIDCDALSIPSLDTLAKQVSKRFSFSQVHGIPSGGERFAKALTPFIKLSSPNVLIVDDVLTTGRSMEEARKAYGTRPVNGVVIFSRESSDDLIPEWILPIFKLYDGLW